MKKITPDFGFTLVELILVIAIIAILAVVGFSLFTNTQANARNSKRVQDLDSIKKSLETHYDRDTGLYPGVDPTWFTTGGIPQDPINSTRNGTPFQYSGIPSGGSVQSFYICANLENGSQSCVNSQQ